MNEEQGKILLRIARNAVLSKFQRELVPVEDFPGLNDPGASFVTIHFCGDLQGCMGSLEPKRRLKEDVWQNAISAAFHDPRFSPLSEKKIQDTTFEVSVLSPIEPILFETEEQARSGFRPYHDGIVFQCGNRKSTFLPQVWEDLPDPEDFLNQLKQKAGFLTTFWSSDVRLFRYAVQKWGE